MNSKIVFNKYKVLLMKDTTAGGARKGLGIYLGQPKSALIWRIGHWLTWSKSGHNKIIKQ